MLISANRDANTHVLETVNCVTEKDEPCISLFTHAIASVRTKHLISLITHLVMMCWGGGETCLGSWQEDKGALSLCPSQPESCNMPKERRSHWHQWEFHSWGK